MALSDPLQLIMIAAIVLVLFVLGPQKIPEIARSIGRAKKEFESASKELQQITKEFQNPTAMMDKLATSSPPATPQPAVAQPSPTAAQPPTNATPPPVPPKTGDQILIETAEKLGISTTGKTREQISEEITSKVKGA